MSGIYLHGLVILDTANVVVRDNIFSHSELRKYVTNNRTEQAIPGVSEWSWDYVNREFCDTKENIQKIAQRWIDENLSTHEQLIAWVDRNWEGITNDIEIEYYIWGLIGTEATHENILINKVLEAYKQWTDAHKQWAKKHKQWTDAHKQWAKKHKHGAEAYKHGAETYKQRKKADKHREESYNQWTDANRQWAEVDKQWADAYKHRVKTYKEWAEADKHREESFNQWTDANRQWEEVDKQWKIKVMKPIFLELLQKYPCRVWEGNK